MSFDVVLADPAALANGMPTNASHPFNNFAAADAILRSSLYAHFSEAMSGLSTVRSCLYNGFRIFNASTQIRAYGETPRFVKENTFRIDEENRYVHISSFILLMFTYSAGLTGYLCRINAGSALDLISSDPYPSSLSQCSP